MTDTRAQEVARKLTRDELEPFVHEAAVQWCGEKDRETSMDDIRYFEQNWWALPGMKARVEHLAVRRILMEQDHG